MAGIPGDDGRAGAALRNENGIATMSEGDFAVWTEANFEAEVLARPGLAVVDFWSDGCAPCRQLSRVLGEVARDAPAGVRFGTVKVEENPALVDRFSVRAAPTLLFVKDGAVVETRTGVDRRQVLKKIVETHA